MPPALQISVLLLTGAASLVYGSDWNYEVPNRWPGQCQGGQEQSPVDLDSDSTSTAHYERLAFINYEDSTDMNIINNGHTVQLNIANPKTTVLASGGLPSVYYLAQMHFHWQSEHTVQGKRLPLELHMVHYERSFKSVGEAVLIDEGIAVVGILFKESVDNNTKLEPLINALELIDGKVNIEHPVRFTPEDLFPADLSKFYRYQGSLTTPGCDETVVWTILANMVPISKYQLTRFNRIQSDHGPIGQNFRPIQSLNGRSVSLTLMAGSDGFKTAPASHILILSIIYSMYTQLRK